MNERAAKRASYADLVALPDDVVGEILGGELYTRPRPAPRHASASSELGVVVGSEFSFRSGGRGGWRILDEPELHLGEDVVVPDIAGWRLPKLETLPDAPHIELAPDWVCEVLSPSTARVDRIVKQAIYAREGVSHLWFVDPLARTVEVSERREGSWSLASAVADEASVALPPFEALEFALGRLWD